MSKLKKIIIAGLLIATSIVLNRFLSIRTPITTIGLAFIATTLSGMLLGPWWTAFVAGIADVIGALLFPTGAFFPGYTLTAIINGLIDGIMLGKAKDMSGKKLLIRAIICHTLVVVCCSISLNTLWTWYLTKKALVVILPTRLINAAVMLPIRVLVTWGLHLLFLKSGLYKKLYSHPGDTDEEIVKIKEEIETEEKSEGEGTGEVEAKPDTENAKTVKKSKKIAKKSEKIAKN